jgi:TRAP-type uncharacterized transport system substrate-binding protein
MGAHRAAYRLRRVSPRVRARLFAASAALAFVLALGVAVRQWVEANPVSVRVSAGHAGSEKVLEWMSLSGDVPGGGLRAIPVVTEGSLEMLERVDRGALDFAFVQGGFDIDRFRNVRQVVGLEVIPLVLLVKRELHEAVAADLGALRGKSVNLGSGTRTGTYWLSRELLAFAGLGPQDYRPTSLTVDRLRRESDASRLPDAVFLVTEPPSPLAVHFTGPLGYRIVPLPYGPAFRAYARAGDAAPADAPMRVRKEHIPDALIPAYAYGVSPPVPPRDVPTIGSRLLLVTHRRTRPATVIRVLEALFDSRWARSAEPPLDKRALRLPPEVALHPGATEFRDRDAPLITGELVSFLSNTLQIVIPLGGGLLFVRGWLKNRRSAGRERSFDQFLALVSSVERQGSALERDGALDGDALHRLNRELSGIKDSAFHYVAGQETSAGAFAVVLLAHIADVRAALAELHRRAGAGGAEDPAAPG